MKRILVYGDSNTWGQKAFNGRYEHDEQWPNMLQRALGDGFEVIQAGLCARIAGDYETDIPHRNGKTAYEVAYLTAYPLDLVIISLGTNDLKAKYERSAQDICADLLWYASTTRDFQRFDEEKFGAKTDTKLLFIAPPNFILHAGRPERDETMRQELISLLKASGENVLVVNDLTMSEDGVHFSKEDHVSMAERVESEVKEMRV